ncbi:cell envelope integrity protein TolA [Thioflexithrix psekupsensis]|uniref:Protein TolA n=1 Tax=Thioflexithrix psekupsensis TaxID=1570016 RepID=A0A251XAG9_9GAMM|nr:cell envelope integrity protein TolA [Thioflexithrix psekupsensis]OUD14971.1 protein TolA [Thioflexithrix psekupsensis]
MRDDFFAVFFAVLFHLMLAVSYWLFSKNTLVFVLPASQNYQVIEAELLIDPELDLEEPPPPLPVVETPVVEPIPEPVVIPEPEPEPIVEEPDESAQLALLELKKQEQAKIEAETERKRIEEQKRKEAAERKRAEEQKRKEKEEAERKRIKEQERKEAAERKRTEAQQRKEKEEAERKRKEAAERKRAEEQKRKEKEEAERKRKEAAAAKAQADAAAARGAADQARMTQRVGQVMALIQQRVKQRWIRPPNTTNALSCIIEVRLLPDGTVGSASVVKSSGNTVFDRSAEQAIRSASPLPVSISQNADVFDKFRQFRFKFDASQ